MKLWPLLIVPTLWCQTQVYTGLGNANPYTDTAGNVWSSDNGCTTSTQFTTNASIQGTSDPTLYQHGRLSASAFSCTYTVASNTFYNVTLKFANTQNDARGSRIFNIFINNALVRSGFDIAATAINPNTAFDLGFIISVSTGQISVNFQPTTGGALIDAIGITATGATLTTNNTFTGTNAFTGLANTFSRLNTTRIAIAGNAFDGTCVGEMGCIINNAIKDIPDGPTEGIIIYAYGGGTISTNPWATIGGRSGIIYFGPGTWTTNVSLILPKAWKVEGYGRGGLADNKNTIITTGASFPTSTPIFQMGINPVDDGVSIRNLGIDCHNVSGVSAILNQFSQEESYVEHVLMVNCPGGALSITGQAQNSGPYSDLEVLSFSCSNCAAGTVPISIGSVTSFRGIHGATINSNGATLPTVALRIDTAGTYSDIHIESAVSSVIIGSQVATNGAVLTNIECGPSITDCVKISNAFSSQNIGLYSITATTGNIITDQLLGVTLTAAGEGGATSMYVLGNGSPPTVVTSSITTLQIFGAKILYKEGTAPGSGTGGYEACYADSTAHSLKCSYNNGTFFNVPLVGTANTWTNQDTFACTTANQRCVVVSGDAFANNNDLEIANTHASGHTWDVGEMAALGHLSFRDMTQSGNPIWSLQATGTGGNEALLTNANTASRTYTFPDVSGTPAINQTGDSVYGTYRVTTNQTITAGASLTAIPGLSWTLPANTALNLNFMCHLIYNQQTAAAADSFGLQDVSVTPTNVESDAVVYTSNVALQTGVAEFSSTTATAVVAFTPGAAGLNFPAYINGLIEQPSNASTSVFQVMAQFTTNNGTILRGSSCQVF